MIRGTFVCLGAGLIACPVLAQTSLEIRMSFVEFVDGGDALYSIEATLQNPTSSIRAIISDLAFTIDWTDLRDFQYNPAFDSTFFGPASVSVTPTQINFSGTNTLPPLNNPGGPDGSNPLQIATFVGDDFSFVPFITPQLTINGQLSGAYVSSPFDDVFFYQNADGSPGTVPFRAYFDYIPAPASAALLGFAGIAVMRRRR